MIQSISPLEAAERCQATGASILDVRTPAEFASVHASIALNIPLDRLDPARLGKPFATENQPIYVICQSGARGQKACEKLSQSGHTVVNIEGGTTAWIAAGLPVIRGKARMSIERQVRITAGTLILTGAGLGFFLHPGFYGLSAFVGAGLTFAGITNTCAMGMLMAKMPWNQRA